MTPALIAQAYGLPSTSKSDGAIVAVIDAGGDSTALSDVNTYRQAFGLAVVPKCSGLPTMGTGPCLAIVNQTGGSTLPADLSGWTGETSLDLAMVSATCPDCNLVVVEASSQSISDLAAATNYAATIPGVVAISNSFGWPETGAGTPFTASTNTRYDHPGILIVASSGDQDYLDQGEGGTGPNFPASSPYVLGIGGTTLKKDPSSSRGWSETVWNDGLVSGNARGTGSGCSEFFAKPSFPAHR